jgi:hypothetical protein
MEPFQINDNSTLYSSEGISTPENLFIHFIHNDHGLAKHKKKSLLTILNSPEAFDHLLVGAAGAAVANAVAKYSELSKPAQTLMSLAGFGIGNIMYNTLQKDRFATYNERTGKSKIKL